MIEMSQPDTKGVALESDEFTAAINRTICTPELADRLKAMTRATGAPQSYHVRQAVKEYLDRKEQE